MKTSEPTAGDAVIRFSSLLKKKREADAKVLELMRHPQATAEQLVTAQQSAVHIDKMMDEAVTALRKRWGVHDTVLVTRWNNEEFDRHDKRFIQENSA